MAKTPTREEQLAADRARLEMMTLKAELSAARDRALLIPEGWDAIRREPRTAVKTRVTLRLDEDVAAWFRRLGPGYQGRINRVLRLFMENVVSGELEGKWERGWDGRLKGVE